MTDYWCFRAVLSGQTLPLETGLEVVMGAEALSVEKTDSGNHLLQAWFDQEPQSTLLDEVVSRSVQPEQIIETQLICHQNRDWLAENRRAFPPLHLGPFWIYGSHVQQNRPAGSLPLLVEGSGLRVRNAPHTHKPVFWLWLISAKQQTGRAGSGYGLR